MKEGGRDCFITVATCCSVHLLALWQLFPLVSFIYEENIELLWITCVNVGWKTAGQKHEASSVSLRNWKWFSTWKKCSRILFHCQSRLHSFFHGFYSHFTIFVHISDVFTSRNFLSSSKLFSVLKIRKTFFKVNNFFVHLYLMNWIDNHVCYTMSRSCISVLRFISNYWLSRFCSVFVLSCQVPVLFWKSLTFFLLFQVTCPSSRVRCLVSPWFLSVSTWSPWSLMC